MRKPNFDTKEFIINLTGFSDSSSFRRNPKTDQILISKIIFPITEDEISIALGKLEMEKIIEKKSRNNKEFDYSLTNKGKKEFNRINKRQFENIPPEIALILETANKKFIREYLLYLEGFYENWSSNLVHVLADELGHGEKLHDNLYICFLSVQSSLFDWLKEALFSANYEVVFRELRSILEGLYLTYSIDSKYHQLTYNEKLEKWEELEEKYESHGKKVFSRSLADDWEESYKLYQELSGYVHASRKLIGNKMAGLHGIDDLKPEFDLKIFTNCVNTWRKIAELACKLANNLLKNFSIQFEILPTIFDFRDYSTTEFETDF